MSNNFWEDRRVFVTGGSGFIGGWLIQALVQQGADVVALVRDWVPQSTLLKEDFSKHVTIVRGDLNSFPLLERIIAEYQIQSVIHLAAQTIVPIANKSPMSTFESNVMGTCQLLEAVRMTGIVDSVVVASSDKAYGDAPKLPYAETMPLAAVYPYDVSKACSDMIAHSYAKTFDLPIAITRCGNFFGGGDLNWNRIVPGTIRSAIRGNSPVIRSDGTLIRDYIYVEDAVDAYLTLSQKLSENPKLSGEAFNFSNETQASVKDLTSMILSMINSELKPQVLGENHGEIKAQFLDATKAKQKLDWCARHGLKDGLSKTIRWYQNYFERNPLCNVELA